MQYPYLQCVGINNYLLIRFIHLNVWEQVSISACKSHGVSHTWRYEWVQNHTHTNTHGRNEECMCQGWTILTAAGYIMMIWVAVATVHTHFSAAESFSWTSNWCNIPLSPLGGLSDTLPFADLVFVLFQFRNFYVNSIDLHHWKNWNNMDSMGSLFIFAKNKMPFMTAQAVHGDAAGLRLQRGTGRTVTSCPHSCFTFSWMGQRQRAGAHEISV